MSKILYAAVSGLSGCTDILVIVWQTAVFFSLEYRLFPIQYVLLHYFYNYVYNIPYNFRKNFCEILS